MYRLVLSLCTQYSVRRGVVLRARPKAVSAAPGAGLRGQCSLLHPQLTAPRRQNTGRGNECKTSSISLPLRHFRPALILHVKAPVACQPLRPSLLQLGSQCLRSSTTATTRPVRFQHECTSFVFCLLTVRIPFASSQTIYHIPLHRHRLTMASQYGNSGYQQMDYGNNPYDQRNDGGAQGGRFNNYAQGRYDDRMFTRPAV